MSNMLLVLKFDVLLSLFQSWQAVYSFVARSPIEVNLEAGQVITVVAQHDLDGNDDWWVGVRLYCLVAG